MRNSDAVVRPNFDYLFKIIVIGESGSGKTSLLHRITHNEFVGASLPTIGVGLHTMSFKINNDVIKAQVWDTAGQERYQAITAAYYRGTHGAMIVYDMSTKGSVLSVEKWVTELRKYIGDHAVLILIGNKSDLTLDRSASKEEGMQMAEKMGVNFIETSAMTGENVERAFTDLIKKTYKKYKLSAKVSLSQFEGDRRARMAKQGVLGESSQARGRKSMCC